ncbi:MAG: DNA-methyltransferase [Actinomycetota bacterium]
MAIIRGNALQVPLADSSVDLIISSPPYWALRAYQDNGESLEGQLGSEETPQAFIDNLMLVMAECWRVLKPSGSCFINLGDKFSNSGGHNNSNLSGPSAKSTPQNPHYGRRMAADSGASRRNAPDRYNQNSGGIRTKSLMGLPWRFAIACIDAGWILRSEIIFSKLNSLPESAVDRVRRSHEQIFHLTKQGRYFAALDEIREVQMFSGGVRPLGQLHRERGGGEIPGVRGVGFQVDAPNPLGKLPGSVWQIPSEPLIIPDWAIEKYNLPSHFAKFCQEIPRRIILGWSPNGICTVCGEGRRPVVVKDYVEMHQQSRNRSARQDLHDDGFRADGGMNGRNVSTIGRNEATITGYSCACTPFTDHKFGASREYHLADWTPPPTRPAVILDPFVGTGTTVMVAESLGRKGIGLDLSADYARLARWRCEESGHGKKAEQRTWRERQGRLI